MTQKLQAAAQIRALANTYKHMVHAAEVLETIGTLDQAVDEAKAALANANDELKATIAANETARQQVREAQELNDRLVQDAKAEADHIRDSAKAEAERIKLLAGADATALMDQTKADASRVAAETLNKVAEKEARLAVVTEELSDVEEAVQAARNELASLRAQSEELRAKLQGLVQNL